MRESHTLLLTIIMYGTDSVVVSISNIALIGVDVNGQLFRKKKLTIFWHSILHSWFPCSCKYLYFSWFVPSSSVNYLHALLLRIKIPLNDTHIIWLLEITRKLWSGRTTAFHGLSISHIVETEPNNSWYDEIFQKTIVPSSIERFSNRPVTSQITNAWWWWWYMIETGSKGGIRECFLFLPPTTVVVMPS